MEAVQVSYEQLLQLARGLEGKTLKTVRGTEFRVGIYMDCPFFIPSSTGRGRSDGRRAAEQFLVRFNEIHSYRPSDYKDVTRNGSYFVVMMQEME